MDAHASGFPVKSDPQNSQSTLSSVTLADHVPPPPPPYQQSHGPVDVMGYPVNPDAQGMSTGPGIPPPYNPSLPRHNPHVQPPVPTTVIVTAQPAPLTNPEIKVHDDSNSRKLATVALVLSILNCVFCGCFLASLICIIPAFVLAISALTLRGRTQRVNAKISIVLSIVAFAIMVALTVIIVPSTVAGTRCTPYSYRVYSVRSRSGWFFGPTTYYTGSSVMYAERCKF